MGDSDPDVAEDEGNGVGGRVCDMIGLTLYPHPGGGALNPHPGGGALNPSPGGSALYNNPGGGDQDCLAVAQYGAAFGGGGEMPESAEGAEVC